MRRLLLALAVALVLAAPAEAASPVAEVLGPSGKPIWRGQAGRLDYPLGGFVVHIVRASSTAAGVELHDVSLLGGRIFAARVFVPARGTADVDGLVVDGKTIRVKENGVVPLDPQDYLVAAQTAVSSSGSVGRVGLRLTLGSGAYGPPAGTQIVIGLPPARSPPRSEAASALAVLGFTGGDAGPVLPGFGPPPFVLGNGSLGEQAVAIAERFLGIPYVWAGASPATGFDCSGLVMYVYGQLGVSLPHYSGAQYREGAPVPPGELEPGDLVFFYASPRGPQHVGIYVGGGRFIQAPHTGDVVKISSLSDAHYALAYVGAVRLR
jgi:hypothetical protein